MGIIEQIICILCITSLCLVNALIALPTNQTIQTIEPAQTNKVSSLWPMLGVNVDKQDNKSQVGVHVPIFFDMTNNVNPETGDSKMDLSVLSGLVTVSKDKTKQPDGRITGPLVVTVFGIPVYTGRAVRRELIPENIGDHLTMGALEKISAPAGHIYSNLKKVNDKTLTAFSTYLSRMAEFIKPKQISNINGEPTDNTIRSMIPNRNFTKSDLEQKTF